MNNYYPDIYKKNIYEINYDSLFENDIKYLLFDLDNTCTPCKEKSPSVKLRKLFINLQDKGFKIILFSNSSKKRLYNFKMELNVDCCPNVGKPGTKKILKIINNNRYKLSQVALIGDQILTDIYCGNKIGITTILVNPISTYENFFTKINRFLEKNKILKMKKLGMFEVGKYYE